MLKINQFYWQLYKESPEGKKTIEEFEKASRADYSIEDALTMYKKYDPEWFMNMNEEETYSMFVYASRLVTIWPSCTSSSPRKKAEELIEKGFNGNYENAIGYVGPLSFFLYKTNPSYFIPYMFVMRYHHIWQILVEYEIDLVEVPGKSIFKNRCLYYYDICDALAKFKEQNGMDGAELCAFLYDMEKKKDDAAYVKKATPFPQVWLIGGGMSKDEAKRKTMCWQANADTKNGDILVMYETGETETGNRSCLTGIWRAMTDGITDPLFYRYGSVIIGDEIKVKPIPFKELLNDDKTNKLPRCGAHFCGVKGDYISYENYENLLRFIEGWDSTFDRARLPILHEPYSCSITLDEARKNEGLKPEQWVEKYFIVEMLKKMGWEEKRDYLRQVHLQMGRAKVEDEKRQDGRPDFSLFFFGHKDKCADVVIEAKGPREMDGDRELEAAFWQAESYASRQYAGLIILADNQRVVLFPRSKDGVFKFIVDRDNNEYTWKVIFNNPDKRNELKKRILSYKKHNR